MGMVTSSICIGLPPRAPSIAVRGRPTAPLPMLPMLPLLPLLPRLAAITNCHIALV
jgi:hypothetical protein